MESNEQTKLTSKTDRLIDGKQMTASWEGCKLRVEGVSKKEKGLIGMDNSVVIAGGGQCKGTKW